MTGGATAGLARQRRKELANDHPRGAVEQAAADACHLAADRRLVDEVDRGAAIRDRNPQGDAPFAAAESGRRAFGGAAERDRMRRIEVGQFDVGAVASLHGTPHRGSRRHGNACRRFSNGVAAGNDGLKGRRVEQHGPDAFGRRADLASPLPRRRRSPLRCATRRRHDLPVARLGAAHEAARVGRHHRQLDVLGPQRIGDGVGDADRCRHAIAFADALRPQRRERRRCCRWR